MDNPGFRPESAADSFADARADDGSTEPLASDGAQDEVRINDEPEPESVQAGTEEASATSLSTPGPSELTSTATSADQTASSDSSSDTTTEFAMCGHGEGHCYLLKKGISENQYLSEDGKGPALYQPELGMSLVQFIDGSPGPFESYVQFSNRSVLEMDSAISAGGILDPHYVGFDLIVRNPRCAYSKRCGFAQMANLVLEVDTETKNLYCSYLSPDKTTVLGKISGPLSPSGVNRVGCGVIKQSISMFVNGELKTARQPDNGSDLITVKVKFGSDDAFLGGHRFLGDVGLMRFWDDHTKMKALLVD